MSCLICALDERIPRVARVHTELPADALRALADGIGDQDQGAALGVNAVRNLARYAPAGKRVRMSIEWEIEPPETPR